MIKTVKCHQGAQVFTPYIQAQKMVRKNLAWPEKKHVYPFMGGGAHMKKHSIDRNRLVVSFIRNDCQFFVKTSQWGSNKKGAKTLA